jgi:hypothetical protein
VTTTIKDIIPAKNTETTQTTQYTATGVKTIIDKFTVTNTTAGNVTMAVNLVASAGTAGTSNRIMSRTIAAGECYTCPELVGHVLESGGFISTLAGAAGLTIKASGREVT